MSQLIIEPYLILGEEDAPAVLPRLPVPGTPGAPSDSLFHVKEWVHMYAGDATSCTILRGKMSIDGQELIPCILKVDLFDQHPRSLLTEASVYENQAKSLQGNVVPRFYGLFQGQVSPGYLPSTCMVLEDCGDHMRSSFPDSDNDLISKLLDKFKLFHDAGLQHNAISERNVTVKNGEPYIIDLKLSRPHRCDRIPIEHGASTPDEYKYGCWELYEFICIFDY
ncbi:hypothetical protein SERLA73DRAFT_69209 [Serpula lacrymans var. lacrymans S7.3]|uniref:Protein kinase domain-containing protein n=1 Tax=Serpula lacrymans var. lacrymans (strain S7.3) TaxID=936435 RepID=F8PKI6_SERL3|nr:hypothetical protein SERLA73DRAFT_69209 [Serpula lacrymans var. lacrymans S7.3]